MHATKDQTAYLNKLLRGEISATETYVQALAKVGHDAGSTELQQIRDEHRDAANTWRQHIHQFGGQPDQDSGAWGYFAKAVEGSAKLFGNTAAMKALKETDLPEECKTLIRSRLLPQSRAHIATLDRLMDRK